MDQEFYEVLRWILGVAGGTGGGMVMVGTLLVTQYKLQHQLHLNVSAANLLQDFLIGVALEGEAASQQRVHQDAGAPHIYFGVVFRLVQDLWGLVVTASDVSLDLLEWLKCRSEAQVGQFDSYVAALALMNKYVLKFDITMYDSIGVQVGQRPEQLHRYLLYLAHAKFPNRGTLQIDAVYCNLPTSAVILVAALVFSYLQIREMLLICLEKGE